MNDIVLVGTAVFFIGTMFCIVKLTTDTPYKKYLGDY